MDYHVIMAFAKWLHVVIQLTNLLNILMLIIEHATGFQSQPYFHGGFFIALGKYWPQSKAIAIVLSGLYCFFVIIR